MIKEALGLKRTQEIFEPFYVDEQRKKIEEKGLKYQILHLESAIHLYKKFAPGDEINSIEELADMVKDPVARYSKWKVKEVENQPKNSELKEFVRDYLKVFERSSLEKEIKLPNDFDELVSACAKVGNVNAANLILRNGKIEFSERVMNKLYNRVYYYADTPLRKKRLAYAEKLAGLLNDEFDELLTLECKERGAKQGGAFKKVLLQKLHIGGLPYPVRLRFDQSLNDPNYPDISANKLEVNPDFVVGGFLSTGNYDFSFLDKREPMPEAPKVIYKRYQRTNLDGSLEQCLVPKDKIEYAYWGMWKEANVTFYDGEYTIDDKGKLVRVDK